MSTSKKDAIGYLDGVPFKIADQCFVMRTVHIPPLEDLVPPPCVTEEYSFELERRVLEEAEEHNKKKSERLKSIASLAALNKEKVVPPSYGSMAPWNPTTILQPQPLPSPSTGPLPPTNHHPPSFNLSDFENDTSSPFDTMELKTLNDIEELNTVFRDLSTASTAAAPTSSYFPVAPGLYSAAAPTYTYPKLNYATMQAPEYSIASSTVPLRSSRSSIDLHSDTPQQPASSELRRTPSSQNLSTSHLPS